MENEDMKILGMNIKTAKERYEELKVKETELAIMVEAIERLMDEVPLRKKARSWTFEIITIAYKMECVVSGISIPGKFAFEQFPTFYKKDDRYSGVIRMEERLRKRLDEICDLYFKKGFTIKKEYRDKDYSKPELGKYVYCIDIIPDEWN